MASFIADIKFVLKSKKVVTFSKDTNFEVTILDEDGTTELAHGESSSIEEAFNEAVVELEEAEENNREAKDYDDTDYDDDGNNTDDDDL